MEKQPVHKNDFGEIVFAIVGMMIKGAILLFQIAVEGVLLIYRLITGAAKPSSTGQGIEDISDEVKKYRLELQLADGGYVGINNPFRGVFIAGGAGSGKSESIIKPLIWEAIHKDYCGIIYDFKDPELCLELCSAWDAYKKENPNYKVEWKNINFSNYKNTLRCNPLAPKYILTLSHAEEYATAIINNLMPESISKVDFWNRSAISILQASIWFFKEERPEQCTLPHIVSFLQSPIKEIIGVLRKNRTCARLISSTITAFDNNAQGQISGTMGTLQLALNKVNTPEIAYVLSKDEVNLDINNKENPTFLTIGNNPTIQDSLSPVISLIMTVCLKMMNAKDKHHSIVILDEAPTIYIPKLESVPATARSNKISVVFCCQDLSQIVDSYGAQKKDILLSNLANQFWGRVNHYETASYMIKLAGKQDVMQTSYSKSSSNSEHGESESKSESQSIREKDVLRIQDIQDFRPGFFVTALVERGNLVNKRGKRIDRFLKNFFFGQYVIGHHKRKLVYESVEDADVKTTPIEVQDKIHHEIEQTIIFFLVQQTTIQQENTKELDHHQHHNNQEHHHHDEFISEDFQPNEHHTNHDNGAEHRHDGDDRSQDNDHHNTHDR